MPLVRYHIRNEYDLANPKLYSSADKDDPEGLIEAVAIAGLVGIIRQLGDLAEFAAEVFNILHEEVLATASKGQELVGRVQQLEAELPSVEKETLSHSNHAILAYNPGMEWHATIQNDQNHFANGDLPHFIRNSYRKCRSPPRVHLLDKFDAAGSGACLKRYSDPSLFKTEWAITEIRKAEKEQEARRSRNFQRKEQQEEESSVNGGSSSTLSRMPYGAPNAHLHQASTSYQQTPALEPKQDAASSSSTVAFQTGKDHPRTVMPAPEREEESGLQPNTDSSPTLAGSQKTLDPIDVPSFQSSQHVCPVIDSEPSDSLGVQVENVLPTVNAGNAADDASETESFVDALATMESETETDWEMRPASKAYEPIMPMPKSTAPSKGNPEKQSTIRKEGFLSRHDAAEEYDKVETAAAAIAEDTPEVNPAIPPDGNSAVGDQMLAKSEFPGVHVLRKEKIGSAPTCKSHGVDHAEQCDSPALTTNKNGTTSSWISEASVSKSATCSNVGQQIDSDSDTISDCLRSHVAKVNPTDVLDGLFSESEAEKISPDDDTTSESTGRISPRRSGDSLIIKPIRWTAKFTRFHDVMLDTDEEMNVPSSTSSSALSSPRPSALATTVSDVDLRNDMMLRLFPDASNHSSLASSVGVSDNGSLRSNRVKFRRGEPKLDSQPSSSGSILSSSMMGSSFGNSHGGLREESQRFPPPPPLPPLKWRTARATKSRDESGRPKSAIFPSLVSVSSNSSGIRFASDEQFQASGIDDPIAFMLPKNVPQPRAFKPFNTANRANLGDDHENSMRFRGAECLVSREGFEMSDESVKESVGRTPATQMWHLKSEGLPDAVESASEVGYGGPLCPPVQVEDIVRGSSQVLSSSGMRINGSASLSASRSEREIFLSPSDESIRPVSRAGIRFVQVPPQAPDSHVLPKAGEDLLVVDDAAASKRRETLQTIPLRSHSSRMASSDERENMLEQIRTGSFNLRHVKVERQDQARPVTSISVAAILEKANAIRQVCDPNIDDGNDGWSDDT